MTRIFANSLALMTALLITTATFAEAIRVPTNQAALATSHLA